MATFNVLAWRSSILRYKAQRVKLPRNSLVTRRARRKRS